MKNSFFLRIIIRLKIHDDLMSLPSIATARNKLVTVTVKLEKRDLKSK